MDISAQNLELWSFITQLGLLSLLLLASNILRTRIKCIKNLLMPTAVIAGFILLLLRSTNILRIETSFLEVITYHGIAIGFIAMSLRVKSKETQNINSEGFLAIKNGAIIVASYVIQAIVGLIISIGLSLTFMPNMFRAAGVLLPMAYGQGPGQANNIGTTYESLGFSGGRSFGLALAATGFLCACIVGVIYLNVLKKKKKYPANDNNKSNSFSTEIFQSNEEMPIAESVDKFSVQIGLVFGVYVITYFIILISTVCISTYLPGLANIVNPLINGFNFMIGSGLAMLTAFILAKLRSKKIVKFQYQNNYLLDRISGVAFDLMIIAGIGSIEIGDLQGLWIPFILISVAGGIATFLFLRWISKKIYKEYAEEGFVSMFGMMTGTISSGILLLRELDPFYETPAANNLITGSGTAILLALPVLLLVGIAPNTPYMPFVVLAIAIVYFSLLLLILFKLRKKNK